MISILLPSRGRPDNVRRLVKSVLDTADKPDDIEIIVRLDYDDPTLNDLMDNPPQNTTVFAGERVVLSEMWNECYELSKGDILMHCGDDIVFRTDGWDTAINQTFEEYPDRIVFVFGNDDSPHNGNFGTHGFIHRKWAEAVGYFVPPYFSSDFNDTWLNDVAKMIGRHRHIQILTEHMHPDFGKAELDQTHKDRIERHQRDNVAAIYANRGGEREKDAKKLRSVML